MKAFIISFLIGLCCVCILGKENKHIYVYPTPQNISKIQYRDATDNCFSFLANEVPCPSSGISTIPFQN